MTEAYPSLLAFARDKVYARVIETFGTEKTEREIEKMVSDKMKTLASYPQKKLGSVILKDLRDSEFYKC